MYYDYQKYFKKEEEEEEEIGRAHV